MSFSLLAAILVMPRSEAFAAAVIWGVVGLSVAIPLVGYGGSVGIGSDGALVSAPGFALVASVVLLLLFTGIGSQQAGAH